MLLVGTEPDGWQQIRRRLKTDGRKVQVAGCLLGEVADGVCD